LFCFIVYNNPEEGTVITPHEDEDHIWCLNNFSANPQPTNSELLQWMKADVQLWQELLGVVKVFFTF
jgi:hypothetical protein